MDYAIDTYGIRKINAQLCKHKLSLTNAFQIVHLVQAFNPNDLYHSLSNCDILVQSNSNLFCSILIHLVCDF